MEKEIKIISIALVAIYAIDLSLCTLVMSGWIYKGTRLFQVLQGSIMLPCEAMFMQGGTTILVSLGFLCVPAILLCVAAIRKSTRFLIAGLIAFGIVWNFATWIGCILSWMD